MSTTSLPSVWRQAEHQHQSDNEPYLKALVHAVASKVPGISTRHSPAYSSQSQGSIERLHRTLFGQARVIREHIRTNYGFYVGMQHPVMSWLIKHSTFLIDNYLIHSDGVPSYFKGWKSDNKTPICEFGESILYMPSPAIKQYPKLENRFCPGIWLGKDEENPMLGLEARSSKQEPSGDKSNHGNTIDN